MKKYIPPLALLMGLYAADAEAKTYRVKSNKTTLESVARVNNLSIESVLACNPNMSKRPGHIVKKGEKVLIAKSHIVKKGETYSGISHLYDLPMRQLDSYNQTRKIYPGKKVSVPCKEKCRTERYDSGLELCIVPQNGDKGRKLMGNDRCQDYFDQGKLEEAKIQCQFYNPQEGNLVEITKKDLEKPITKEGNIKLYELVRCNFPWLIPRKHRIAKDGEWFFRYMYFDKELGRKMEALRKRTGKPIRTARDAVKWENQIYPCTPFILDSLARLGRRVQDQEKKKELFKLMSHCRKHGFRPFVYNWRMNEEVDFKPRSGSDHVFGKAVDITTPYYIIRNSVERTFGKNGVGKGQTTTHLSTVKSHTHNRKRRWAYGKWRRPMELDVSPQRLGSVLSRTREAIKEWSEWARN